MKRIHPCLWFNTEAEEAAKYYTSLFPHSKLGRTSYYGEAAALMTQQKKGSVLTIEFETEGLTFEGLNGGPMFEFSPALSFFVRCESEKEIEELWKKLSAGGGSILWELKKYPWSEKYGWCTDRFGVSWQLILAPFKQKICPAFLFTDKLFGKGEEAIQFYLSQFSNSKILTMDRDPKTKSIMHSTFQLDGQEFVLMEGQSAKIYRMSPATSFVVNCKDQKEVDHYWETLPQGGGSHSQCGWLEDKYGVSWQIVPTALSDMMSDKDPERVENVMKAMLKMSKLDIDVLTDAFNE